MSSSYGKPRNVVITDIEFFSDLDVRTIEESSKEQITQYLRQEVQDAIELYDKIARSFGKRGAIIKWWWIALFCLILFNLKFV